MAEPKLLITATHEVTTPSRLEQSAQAVEREGLKPLAIGKHISSIFKRGVKLNPDNCFMTTPLDNWTPTSSNKGLVDRVEKPMAEKVDRDFDFKGIAGTIALTDTAAGVREIIEYDENEQIVMEQLQHPLEREGDSDEQC